MWGEKAAPNHKVKHDRERAAGKRHHKILRHPAVDEVAISHIPINRADRVDQAAKGAGQDYDPKQAHLVPKLELITER